MKRNGKRLLVLGIMLAAPSTEALTAIVSAWLITKQKKIMESSF
ncbi:MAG: hypothetical protein SOU03_11440 [Dorea sp.]|nr:hypothetical protein [Dorea sp.]